MRDFTVIFLILVSFLSCEEAIFNSKYYPYVYMKSAEKVTEGNLLRAEVLNLGTLPIQSHGFVWGKKEGLTLEGDSVILLSSSSTLAIGEFSAILEGELITNSLLYVRPFIETERKLVYGNEIFIVGDQ